jgi:hypothetical protein
MYLGRRKRYIIVTSIAVFTISVALYNAAESNPYKNSKVWNFDSYQKNTVPNGFLSMETGNEEKVTWIVKSDESAPSKPNVLFKLLNNDTGSGHHMLIIPDAAYSNFKASVKFRIISGEKEQAAGLIVRFLDRSHYFALFADVMKDRFSLCRAEFENMICIQDRNVNVTTGKWYTITAQVAAQGIAGYLDDKLLIQRYDQHYMTGQIGLWSKEDTEAYFDDLKIDY